MAEQSKSQASDLLRKRRRAELIGDGFVVAFWWGLLFVVFAGFVGVATLVAALYE